MRLIKSAALIALFAAFAFGFHLWKTTTNQPTTPEVVEQSVAPEYAVGIQAASDTKKVSIASPVNSKKLPERSAKVAEKKKAATQNGTSRITSLLGDLQQRVNLKRPIPAKDSKSTQGRALNDRMGIRQVDVMNDTTDSEYTIPSGDVFLDSSAVGEVGPSDDIVQ